MAPPSQPEGPSALDHDARALDLLSNEVDSFEKLEALALLGRAPDGTTSPANLIEALRLPPALGEDVLGGLMSSGLLVLEGGRLRLADTERGRGVPALLRIYEEDKVAVLNFLTKRSMARIRRSIPEAFAMAFRIRAPRDSEGGGGERG